MNHTTALVVSYPVTTADIEKKLEPFRGLVFTDTSSYRQGTQAIAACRSLRVEIEERRKLLKADSITYGRQVDSVAKTLTELVESYELQLKADKKRVDDEREAAKQAKLAAERAEQEAKIRAEQEAALEARRLVIEAELAAKRAEQEERERAFQAQLAEQTAAQQKAAAEAAEEREATRLERARLAEERRKMAEEHAEIQAQVRKQAEERRAAELAARLAAEAEEERIHQLEWEAQKARRLAALAPDVEKLAAYAQDILRVCEAYPKLEDAAAKATLTTVRCMLHDAAGALQEFKP